MRILRGISWQTLLLELLIVFIGLLAALQVDQWREDREYHEAETRYLHRLAEDLEASLGFTRNLLAMLEPNRRAVHHVSDSLAAGEIIDGDTALFERGIIRVGHLPSASLYRSAYDEMVASGMFARLRSEDLKRAVSNLFATEEVVKQNFAWWRQPVLELERHYNPHVLFGYGRPGVTTVIMDVPEPERAVTYDFEALRADRNVRNGFYWAADTHDDWSAWVGRLTTEAEAALLIVQAELAKRPSSG